MVTSIVVQSFNFIKRADVELNPRPKRVSLSNISICDALRDLVPFVQYKKREKHPWITLPRINTVVFVSITKTFCLCEFSVFNICKNVLISN